MSKAKNKINSIKKRNHLLTYLLLVLGATILFSLRFPLSFTEANFYAEDGKVFLLHIMQQGFWEALFTKFNGYFTVGMYGLTGIAYGLHSLLQQQFVTLPLFISFVANLFFATVVCTPYLLFKKYFNSVFLILLIVFSVFIPFYGWDYAAIGVIGNTKFLFMYLAMLLTIYRIQLSENNKKSFIIDALLLICALTNPAVYFLLPLIYLKYMYLLLVKKESFKKIILKNISAYSALILGLLLLVSVLSIVTSTMPKSATYLSDPFEMTKFIEVVFARSFIFPLIHFIYPLLNNLYTLIITAILAALFFLYSRRDQLLLIVTGLYTIIVTTGLLLIGRSGIHTYFHSYEARGPAHFFYTQNIITLFLVFLLLSAILQNQKASLITKYFLSGIVITLLTISVPLSGTFGMGRNTNYIQEQGTLEQNITTTCRGVSENVDTVQIKIYPNKNQSMKLPFDTICSK